MEVTNTDDRALDVVVDVLLQPTEVDEAGTFAPMRTFAHLLSHADSAIHHL